VQLLFGNSESPLAHLSLTLLPLFSEIHYKSNYGKMTLGQKIKELRASKNMLPGRICFKQGKAKGLETLFYQIMKN
jgi:hypothetical protein